MLQVSFAQIRQILRSHYDICNNYTSGVVAPAPGTGFFTGTLQALPVTTIPGVSNVYFREHGIRINIPAPLPGTTKLVLGTYVWFSNQTRVDGFADEFTIRVYRQIGANNFQFLKAYPFKISDIRPGALVFDNFISFGADPIDVSSGGNYLFAVEVKNQTSNDVIDLNVTRNTTNNPGLCGNSEWFVHLANVQNHQSLGWQKINSFLEPYEVDNNFGNPIILPVTQECNFAVSANKLCSFTGTNDFIQLNAILNGGRHLPRYDWNPVTDLVDQNNQPTGTIPNPRFRTLANSPTGSFTYQVLGRDTLGCRVIQTITLYRYPRPQIQPTTPGPLPQGGSITLYLQQNELIGSGFTYQWLRNGQPISGANTFSYEVTTPGNYQLRVTSTNGCQENSNIITIDAAGTFTDRILCMGRSVCDTLPRPNDPNPIPANADSIRWSTQPGGGIQLPSDDRRSIVVCPTRPGTFSYTATFKINNQIQSRTYRVNVISVPAPTIATAPGQNPFICEGQSVELRTGSVGTGCTIQWLRNDQVIPGATGTTYRATTAGIYKVRVNCSNCTNTSGSSVLVRVQPAADITVAQSADTICPGEIVRVIVRGAGPQASFSWAPTDGIDNPRSPTPFIQPNATTTYTLTVDEGTGCITTRTIRVVVVQLPQLSVTATGNVTRFCQGDSVLLSATVNPLTPGLNYRWYRNDFLIPGANSDKLWAKEGGRYRVEVSIRNCTPTTAVIDLDPVSPRPTARLKTPDSRTGCNQATGVRFTLESNYPGPYEWYRNNTLIPGATGRNYTATQNGAYFARVIVGQCTVQTQTENVVITPGTPPQATAIPRDTAMCPGGSLVMDVRVTGASGNIVYDWTPAAAFLNPSIKTPATRNLNQTVRGEILIRDGRNCEAKDSFAIRVAQVDTITIRGSQNFCENASFCLQSSFGRGFAYQWYKQEGNNLVIIPGARNFRYCSNQPGAYVLEISGINCVTHRTEAFTVRAVPAPKITLRDRFIGICVGGQAFLRADATFDGALCTNCRYQWTPNQFISDPNVQNPRVQPTTRAIYTVTVTGPNNCTARDSVIVNVAELGLDTTRIFTCNPCAGGKVILTASTGRGFRYQWFREATPIPGATDFQYEATQTGRYNVRIEGANAAANCPQNYFVEPPVNIAVIPAPRQQARILPDRDTIAICEGGTPTLTATGGNQYEWRLLSGDPLSMPVNTTTASITVDPDRTSTYVVRVTDTNLRECNTGAACVSFDTVTVRVVTAAEYCQPEAKALSVCENNNLRLRACLGVGFVYRWYKNGVLINGATNYYYDITNASLSDGGVYTAEVILEPWTNCPPRNVIGTFQVTVLPKPVIEITPIFPAICPGGRVRLIPNGAPEFIWSPSPSLDFTTPPATNFTPIAKPSTSTTYTVTARGINGCVSSREVFVKVVRFDTVRVQIIGSAVACQGDSVRLCASSGPGFAYQWRNRGSIIPGATDVCYFAKESGNYSVDLAGSNPEQNCAAFTTPAVPLIIRPTPIAIADRDTATCINTTVPVQLTGERSQGNIVSYEWRPTTFLDNPNAVRPRVVSPTQSITYTLTVTAANGCRARATANVAVVNLDTVRILGGGLVQICEGSFAILTISQRYLQYQWFRDGAPIAGANRYQFRANLPGLYTVQISAPGCSTVTTPGVRVVVNPRPRARIVALGSTQFCQGGRVVLAETTNFAPGHTFQWLRNNTPIAGATQQNISANQTGDYRLIVTNSFGCSDTSNVIGVKVNTLPNVRIVAENAGAVLCQNQSQTLVASVIDFNLRYNWAQVRVSGNDTIILRDLGNTPRIIIASGGTYILDVTDAFGCRTRAAITISVAPNTMKWDKSETFTRSPASCGENSGYIKAQLEQRIPGEEFEFYIQRVGDVSFAGPFFTGFNFIEFNKELSNNAAFAISPGFYRIRAVDAVGCRIDTVLRVSDQVDFRITDHRIKRPSCANDDGEITICVEGAPTGEPFFYSRDNGRTYVLGVPVIPGVSDCYTFSNLGIGEYAVLIKRGDCVFPIDSLINFVSPDVVDYSVIQPIVTKNTTCAGNDGSIEVSVAGLPTGVPFYFSIDGGQTYNIGVPISPGISESYTFTDLSPGTYTILIKRGDIKCTGVRVEATIINECCPAPVIRQPAPGAIDYTSATLAWLPISEAIGYEVIYKPLGTTDTVRATTNNTFFTARNLQPSRDYQFCVRTLCNTAGRRSIWKCYEFSTLECNPPERVEVMLNQVTFTQARVTWTPVPNAVRYELLYGINGTENMTGFTSVATEEFLFNLEVCSEYIVSIRSVCGAEQARSDENFVSFSTPCCNSPLNISAIDVSHNRATIVWDAVETATIGYTLRFGLIGFPTSTISIPAGTTRWTLTDLAPEATYFVEIIANCSTGINSDPINTFFATLPVPLCSTPFNLVARDITTTSALITWEAVPEAENYEVVYLNQFGQTFGPFYTGGDNFYFLTGLVPANSYTVQVRSICELGLVSDADLVSFSTRGPCPVPSGLNVGSVRNNSAIITWSVVSQASSYEVAYRANAIGAFRRIFVTENQATLIGLEPQTFYEVRVRSICAVNDTSASSTTNFVTFPDCETVATPFTFSEITSQSLRLSWQPVPNALYYIVDFKIAGAPGPYNPPRQANTPTLTFTGLEGGTSYEFRVRAVCNGNIESDPAIDITTTLPACQSITNIFVRSVTTTQATLSWEPVAGALRYKLYYKRVGDLGWSLPIELGNSDLPYTLTGLNPATSYDVQALVVCTGNVESDPVFSSFSTPELCVPPSNVSFSEITSNSFEVAFSASSNAIRYELQYREFPSGNWQPVITLNLNQLRITLSALVSETTYEVRIRAVCQGGSFSSYVTATVTTLPAPGDCQAPITSPIVRNVTSIGATLIWDVVPDVASYRIFYKEVIAGSWNQIIPDITEPRYTFTNLLPNRSYEVQVRSVCSGNISDPIYVAFSTIPESECAAPDNLRYTNFTLNSVTLNWDPVPTAISYVLQFKEKTSNTWSSVISTPTINFTFGNLTSSTSYDVRLRAVCVNNVFSDERFSDFTTLLSPTCLPTEVSAVDVTESTALIVWAPVNNNQYEFRYRTIDSPTWILITLGESSVQLTGLTPQTVYVFQIRAKCSDTDFSATTAGSFTTDNVACAAPGTLNVTPQVNSARVDWAPVAAAQSYLVEWAPDVPGNVVWSRVSINHPLTSTLISNLEPNTQYLVRVRSICGATRSGTVQRAFTTLPSKVAHAVETANISVYPNPNSGTFNIEWSISIVENREILLSLVNLTGQEVYRQKLELRANENLVNVQLPSSIVPGAYLLNITEGDSKYVTKLIVR
ncbi:MAG: fibronectin type III domain-containing protein [Bacteroidia bacterium]|nr:fibronectin type III domain-containing protein [Bacteroidia bacterium]MDW8158569.1 fibronectin type III domain-containing protein [Bacteroidia bacterium]